MMDEVRSYYVGRVSDDLTFEPCAIRKGRIETRHAPERPGAGWHPAIDKYGEEIPDRWERRVGGTAPLALVNWLHAHAPVAPEPEPQLVGKWLLRMPCEYVARCWELVRDATLDRSLGVAAKVSTDFGNESRGLGAAHVICVYSADWRDERDVLRVAASLKRIDAVRKMTLSYKPDLFTYAGMYVGNNAGDVAIYTARPPYRQLVVKPAHQHALELLADGALLERIVSVRSSGSTGVRSR